MQASRNYAFLILVVALAALSGFLFSRKTETLGLDVVGGVRLVYELDYSKLPANTSKGEAQARTVGIMSKRAQGGLGVTESNIQAKGDDQIIVEIPGANISLKDAQDLMGKTARLSYYHAKTVNKEGMTFRPYTGSNVEDPTDPHVDFIRSADNKEIKPGDPAYAEIIKSWGEPLLTGEDIQDAAPTTEGTADVVPAFTFSDAGARKMEQWSRTFYGQQEMLAAVLDDKVINISPLAKDAILGKNAVIKGKFDPTYVRTLTELFKAGALPVPLKEISSYSVDPTIGHFAYKQIQTTGAIAFVAVALFLVVYYVFPGVIALVALALYVLFTLTVLKYINATFSLAAIAGFILSVGMAVDANILVFERFKEEMREGRSLKTAIDLGFNRAFPAILDSNACTILTSLVLYRLGTGPVQGFATTLIIGVLVSLFTAVVVTRSLLKFIIGNGVGTNPRWYGLGRNWFGESFEARANETPLNIIQKNKLWFAISAISIIPGVVILFTHGLNLNVDFRGGYEASVAITDTDTTQSLGQALNSNGFKDTTIKFAEGRDSLDSNKSVKFAILTIPTGDLPASITDTQAKEKIASAVGKKVEDIRGYQKVSGTVRDETVRNAVNGVIYSAILIILWLTIRFGVALGGFVMGMRFAISVILALFHDILFVVGMAALTGALFGWEVSALFISAMLTVIGFSTHDTIVIFDRIRENLNHPLQGEDMTHLVNRSISQSVARSLNTSFTVILTLLLLVFFGSATPDLRLFNATMLAGIVSGTYSSIFNAAPILYLWDMAVTKRKGEEFSMIAIAKHAAAERARNALRTRTEMETPEQSYGTTKRRRARDQYTRNIDE